MPEALTELVHSILQHGIQLKKRVTAGEPLILENEQALLKKMLLSETDARRWPDYGGDVSASQSGLNPASRSSVAAAQFLGIRYALVCWLDEMFLIDSRWDTRWNENKLELALYGTNDRAWRFWEQAKLAETRQGSDSLSAFFLCVMLGFRGDLGEHPDELQGWVENCKRRLLNEPATQWTRPPELAPVTNVPPLRGREMLKRMVLNGGALMLVMIPILAIFLVLLFIRPHDLPFGKTKAPSRNAPSKTDSGAFPEENP